MVVQNVLLVDCLCVVLLLHDCMYCFFSSAPTDVGVCGSEESSFTPEQQNKVVDLHNVLRSGEASANMIKMVFKTINSQLSVNCQSFLVSCQSYVCQLAF